VVVVVSMEEVSAVAVSTTVAFVEAVLVASTRQPRCSVVREESLE
jgi:hypothetical protein